MAASSTSFLHSLLFLILLLLINFLTYCYTFSNFSPPFYIFISLLLFTLISLFLYLPLFIYFATLYLPLSSFIFYFSYSPPLTINLQFSSLFYSYFFSHIKCYLSLSLSLSHSHTHTHTHTDTHTHTL